MSEAKLVIDTGSQVSLDRIKDAFYLTMGFICQCGTRKRHGNPFCNDCMNRLPVDLRNRLYVMIRRPYVIAFEEAQKLLPVKEPAPCACGCGNLANFPYRFIKGHGKIKPRKAIAPTPTTPQETATAG